MSLFKRTPPLVVGENHQDNLQKLFHTSTITCMFFHKNLMVNRSIAHGSVPIWLGVGSEEFECFLGARPEDFLRFWCSNFSWFAWSPTWDFCVSDPSFMDWHWSMAMVRYRTVVFGVFTWVAFRPRLEFFQCYLLRVRSKDCVGLLRASSSKNVDIQIFNFFVHFFKIFSFSCLFIMSSKSLGYFFVVCSFDSIV